MNAIVAPVEQGPPRQALVEALREKQGEGSVRGLARTLGISPAHMARIMGSDDPIGKKALRAIQKHYPDLGHAVTRYMLEGEGEEGGAQAQGAA